MLESWSGLGYYSRARNLHRAAQAVVARHGGHFPSDFEAVLALPGIGRSTAAAICVFAHGARHAILDGNVKRLLARCFSIVGYPGDSAVQAQLWLKAEELLPPRDVEAYTQGLMDLGTAVCTRGKPRCTVCPFRRICTARIDDRIAELPTPRPRKQIPQRRTQMLVLLHAGQVLLEKRVASGIWGGLWSLPEIEPGVDLSDWCARQYGAEIATHESLPTVPHGFTHFKLDIEPHKVVVARMTPHASTPGVIWLPLEESLAAAIPAPVRRILGAL